MPTAQAQKGTNMLSWARHGPLFGYFYGRSGSVSIFGAFID